MDNPNLYCRHGVSLSHELGCRACENREPDPSIAFCERQVEYYALAIRFGVADAKDALRFCDPSRITLARKSSLIKTMTGRQARLYHYWKRMLAEARLWSTDQHDTGWMFRRHLSECQEWEEEHAETL